MSAVTPYDLDVHTFHVITTKNPRKGGGAYGGAHGGYSQVTYYFDRSDYPAYAPFRPQGGVYIEAPGGTREATPEETAKLTQSLARQAQKHCDYDPDMVAQWPL